MRFAFGETDFNRNLGEGLWEHVYASDKEDSLVDLRKIKKSRFLVIEDFETTGLLGDPQANDDQDWSDEEKEIELFLYFVPLKGNQASQVPIGVWVSVNTHSWTQVGQCSFTHGKKQNKRWCRSPSHRPLSASGTHKVNGQTYKPDGWWANHIGMRMKRI